MMMLPMTMIHTTASMLAVAGGVGWSIVGRDHQEIAPWSLWWSC